MDSMWTNEKARNNPSIPIIISVIDLPLMRQGSPGANSRPALIKEPAVATVRVVLLM